MEPIKKRYKAKTTQWTFYYHPKRIMLGNSGIFESDHHYRFMMYFIRAMEHIDIEINHSKMINSLASISSLFTSDLYEELESLDLELSIDKDVKEKQIVYSKTGSPEDLWAYRQAIFEKVEPWKQLEQCKSKQSQILASALMDWVHEFSLYDKTMPYPRLYLNIALTSIIKKKFSPYEDVYEGLVTELSRVFEIPTAKVNKEFSSIHNWCNPAKPDISLMLGVSLSIDFNDAISPDSKFPFIFAPPSGSSVPIQHYSVLQSPIVTYQNVRSDAWTQPSYFESISKYDKNPSLDPPPPANCINDIIEDLDQWTGTGWDPRMQSWKEFNSLIRLQFSAYLKAYKDRTEKYMQSAGYIKGKEVRDPSPYDWFVLHRIHKWSYEKIAENDLYTKVENDVSTIRKAIKKISERVFLPSTY